MKTTEAGGKLISFTSSLGLFFNPADVGDMFLRIVRLSPNYTT
jgi:hypothetical protein